VAASKPALSEVEGPKALGMVNAEEAVLKDIRLSSVEALRLRLPPSFSAHRLNAEKVIAS